MRWVALWALVVPALLLAGCGAKDGGANQVQLGDGERISLDLPKELEPAPEDIRGAVSGIVVNEAIFPVPGATVRIQDRDYQTVSSQDGKFNFTAMPPGLYTLIVQMEGYGDGLGTINVRSGQVTKSILQIQHLPVLDPYHQTLSFDVVHNGADAFMFGPPERLVPFDMKPATVIIEAVWTGLVDAPTSNLQYEVRPESDPETSRSGSSPSPLYVVLDSDFFPRGEYAVRFSVYPGSLALPPESRGQVFVTLFYVDRAPQGWSFVEGDQ